jgi:hypothetical protein
MKLLALLALASASALAQDGGVSGSTTSTSMTGSARPDAGQPVTAQAAPAPPSTPAVDHSAELASLRAEVRALKATAQDTNAKLQATLAELQQVRAQLADQQQQQQQQQQQSVAPQTPASVPGLQPEAAASLAAADQQLAAGNTAIEGTLTRIEGSLGTSARLDLANMRAALQNNDLTTARQYLAQAVADAQAGK